MATCKPKRIRRGHDGLWQQLWDSGLVATVTVAHGGGGEKFFMVDLEQYDDDGEVIATHVGAHDGDLVEAIEIAFSRYRGEIPPPPEGWDKPTLVIETRGVRAGKN